MTVSEKTRENSALTGRIVNQAKYLGASIAGIADITELKISPSHVAYGQLAAYNGVGTRKHDDNIAPGKISWPASARSAVVIGIGHPRNRPELDWWDGDRGTPGNRVLIDINRRLSAWLEKDQGMTIHLLPYHVERGGIFLKDAAVLAGLGCIGKNNLLVTPAHGPRIRLRALLTNERLAPTGPVAFDPCESCRKPCRTVCPQAAFSQICHTPDDLGIDRLPAGNGAYSRTLCNIQMEKDAKRAESEMPPNALFSRIKWCRRCEFACPVGKR